MDMSTHPEPRQSDSAATFHRTMLRFALIMLAVGLLSGISFQESTKKLPLALEAGLHLATRLDLALVHGHAFVLGVLLPLALSWMLHLGGLLGAAPLSARTLAWTRRLFVPGVAFSVLLMLLKGYHLVLGVRFGEPDPQVLHASFLGGKGLLRILVYALPHTAMGVGLGVFGVAFWRSLKRRSA